MSEKSDPGNFGTVVQIDGDEADPEVNKPELNESEKPKRVSHFTNTAAHPALVRYGYIVALCVILGLLLTADLGSGITTYYYFILDGNIRGLRLFDRENEPEETLTIFSSMKESWDIGAKGTAIVLFITSVWWPYAKLILLGSFWFVPFNPVSRKGKMETAIELVELFGKFSLTDIFLFIVYIVAFDISSVTQGTLSLDDDINVNGTITATGVTKIDPRWGMSLFTFTSVLGLFASHYMLWTHRQVFYEGQGQVKRLTKEPDDSKETMSKKIGKNMYLVIFILLLNMSLNFGGYFASSMRFNMRKPNIENKPVNETVPELNMTLIMNLEELKDFSVEVSMASIGTKFLDGTRSRDTFNVRIVQFFYYVMTIVAPTLNLLSYSVLYAVPLTRNAQIKLFHAGEYAYAWHAYGVMAIVMGIAYFQIPSFNESTEKDCGVYCHISETEMLGGYVLSLGAPFFQILVNYFFGNRAHKALYTTQIIED
jgi:hypothetical protein